ncbi:hypothetical protein [Methanococcus maripaludis]|uniref:EF-hand domain-containing protein n=1 Tax=Methanococcus maripaludis TaxID=39152 RepID=A0A7J9PNU6_METMI|nr:hypothetical protein [Methanococcus maripaludis]MBA2864444.1 hypothetical protein [Methanococcus maripaludis]
MFDKEAQVQQKADLDEKLKECLECGHEFYGDACPECLSKNIEVKKESKLKNFLKLFKTDKKQYVSTEQMHKFLKENPEMLELVRIFYDIQVGLSLWVVVIMMGSLMLILSLFMYTTGQTGLPLFKQDMLLCGGIFAFSLHISSAMKWLLLQLSKPSKRSLTFIKILKGDFQ